MLPKIVLALGFLLLFSWFEWLSPSNKKMKQLEITQKALSIKLKKVERELKAVHTKLGKKNIIQQKKKDPNKVYNVSIGNSYVYGKKSAPVTIVKWFDYQCPYCAQSVKLVDDIMKKYPNDVKIVFKNFPLNFHKEAKKAAKYSLAAEKQGKYMEMYHGIFSDYRKLKDNEDYPLEVAKKLGLDIEKLKKDIKDPSLEKKIKDEMTELRNTGIPRLSVPKFLINGKEPQGRDFNLWSQMIDKELKKINKEKKG